MRHSVTLGERLIAFELPDRIVGNIIKLLRYCYDTPVTKELRQTRRLENCL